MFALQRRNRAVNLSFPVRYLFLVAGAATVLLVLTGFGAQFAINRFTDYGRLRRLESENARLRETVETYGAAIDTFHRFMANTEQMDNRLRCATGLYLIPGEVRMMGVGGNPPVSRDLAIDNLLRRVSFEERSLAEIDTALAEQAERLRRIPSIWPVQGWVTSNFGYRRDPFTGRRRMHDGIDIVAPYGSAIAAPADGRVSSAGWKYGWGRCVEIDHGNGIRTFFAHCRSLAVKPGDTVKRGEKIATVGSSGRSTGTHLHYGVKRNGSWVNPRNYIIDPL